MSGCFDVIVLLLSVAWATFLFRWRVESLHTSRCKV